jgi:hypothetical protein
MSAPTPCREPGCPGLFAFLKGKLNPKTGKRANVPVDWNTLTSLEMNRYLAGESFDFDKTLGHVSHYETCTNPGKFTKGKK